MTVFVCRDWYRYHHPFIIPLKMILITWLKIHNTEQDFLIFKYMINIIWYGSFRITSRINPRPISSLELKLSGWYWCLGLIRDVIRKEPYNILYLSIIEKKHHFVSSVKVITGVYPSTEYKPLLLSFN